MAGLEAKVPQGHELQEILESPAFLLSAKNPNKAVAVHSVEFDENDVPTNYTYLFVNQQFIDATGPPEYPVGKTVTELFKKIQDDPVQALLTLPEDKQPKDIEGSWISVFGEVAKTEGATMTLEQSSQALGGQWFDVFAYCPKEGYFIVEFTNSTGEVETGHSLDQQIEGYAALYEAATKLLSAENEQAVLAIACETIVENLKFNMAWAGITDQGTQRVLPIASCGDEHGYLDNGSEVIMDDASISDCATSRAMHTLKPVLIENMAAESAYAPWLEAIEQSNFITSMALPMHHEEELFGTLNVYSCKPDYITPVRQFVLEGLALLTAIAIKGTRAQEEIIARQATDRFVTTVAHDLRTPLSTIKIFLGLLEKSIESQDPDRMERNYDILYAEVDGLISFVTDILVKKKLDSGELELHAFDIVPNIRNLIERRQHLIDEKGLAIKIQAPEQAFSIHTDKGLLEHAIDNLIMNAIKFTEEGGITISVNANEPNQTFEISVTDTGIGINPEELPRLFDPHFRGEQTRAQVAGFGIGLSIVQNIVERLGGQVSVNSEGVGQGSTFTISIPLS